MKQRRIAIALILALTVFASAMMFTGCVKKNEAAPSASPTPSGEPSPSASPAASATPSASASPAASPAPSASASPAASTAPSPSASPVQTAAPTMKPTAAPSESAAPAVSGGNEVKQTPAPASSGTVNPAQNTTDEASTAEQTSGNDRTEISEPAASGNTGNNTSGTAAPETEIIADEPAGNTASARPTATAAPTATPHVHTIVVDLPIEATCRHTGKTEGSHCSECGQVIQAQEEIPIKPHMFTAGHCIWCGLPDPSRGDRTEDVIELPAL